MTGNLEKDEFLVRVMDHFADQYNGAIGSDPPTTGFPRVGDRFDELRCLAGNVRRLSVGTAAQVDEQGIPDGEIVGRASTRGIHQRQVGNFHTPASGGRRQGEPKSSRTQGQIY